MKSINFKKVNFCICILIILAFVLTLFIQSGIFAKPPKVEEKAQNCYKRTLTVITDQDYKPYSFVDKEGNFSGHDVELINILADKLEMNLSLKLMSWEQCIEEITSGRADILMTCDYADSFKGSEKLFKSEPISVDDFLVYSKKKITSRDQLYGKRIAVMKNGNAAQILDKLKLTKYITEYEDNEKAMKAVIYDDADVAIMRKTAGSVLLRKLNTKKIKGYISFDKSEMCFGIISSKPDLVIKINDALEEIKIDGQMDQLRNKWLTTFVKPYNLGEILSNNKWIILFLFVLVIFTILGIVKNRRNEKQAKEQQARNEHVVEQLAKDFVCVIYIDIKDNKPTGPVLNYRFSEKLNQTIPSWAEETDFEKKLILLSDNAVYAPDRSKFDEDVKITKILDSLKTSDVYFVNTRFYFDNEIHYYQFKFTPVYENKILTGLVTGLHSLDDKTKKEMELQEQLKQALSNAEVANKAKTEFLFNITHDIRTPLNAILGFTSMSIKYIDNKEKVQELLHKTQLAGNLLSSLINGVLDVSRIETGEAKVDLQKNNINSSFVNIETTMQELAKARDIDLTFEFKNITDKLIYCDVNRCNRVFVNIISNAIKYGHEGGYVKVTCEQASKPENGYATFRYIFEDNGIGMSEEFQKHVFEQFTRDKAVTNRNIQGTGLGLAVCKSFIDLMNGKIECKSELGKGSTFIVTIPFKLQENPNNLSALKDSLKSNIQINKNYFKNQRVIVADDSEMNLEITYDMLTDEGFIVETVLNGEEVLKRLEVNGPEYYSFILMDIRMPVMGGYEATKIIREKYPDNKIPIIAVSANAFDEDRAASLEAGMDAHVAKPIMMEELFKVLISFLDINL